MARSEAAETGRIAVVGMAGRFPGADSVDELWNNLSRGVESIQRFSRQEMLAEGVPAELLDDPSYVPAGGALNHPDRFAAAFFGYSPREALIMDPQQRLFLECCWEALEVAGYGSPSAHNPIGVYAAVSLNTYLLNRLVERPDVIEALVDIETTIGSDKDFLASRVAYKLDLRGPTVVAQSACSSSLVAIHLARQALLTGDCDIALAGGTSVDVPQRAGYLYKPDGIYSSDGHCRPFDARANGMVGGSGAGVVVLKRLERALADGDTIHAVVRGSAINNDGANKVGYTAPSVEAQAAVVAAARRAAAVDSAAIHYVEAHGTATPLGDPIEVEALSEAFGPLPPHSCVLGSVKSNLGHLNAAAGVTGFIKAVLAVRHGTIPATLHFETPNPHIDLERTPFWINDRTIEWPRDDSPRRAGVSSFGMGGTNAHVVLEEPPPPPPRTAGRGPSVLPLSARTESALQRVRRRLGDHLERQTDVDMGDVAHTLQVGRKPFLHRLAVVATSRDDAIDALRGGAPGAVGSAPAAAPAIAFLFPGQGAQHPGMAAALAKEFPAVADLVSDGCRQLGDAFGRQLERLLLQTANNAGDAEKLEQTEFAQPGLFLVEYALGRLCQDLGIRPSGMLGHSIGEYTAACLAGVFSFADAVALVRERGRLMQSMPPGAMLAVALSESEIGPRLGGGLVVAALNEPSSSVVSGPLGEIDDLERRLAAEEIASRRLKTSHAFHSPLMQDVAGPLGDQFRRIDLAAPRTPFVSNVSGTWITVEEATDPDYWSRHLLAPVRFSAGLESILASGVGIVLELGPGTTLTNLARRSPARQPEQRAVATMAHPKKLAEDVAPFLGAIAEMWSNGVGIDWDRLGGDTPRRRVPLPTYPFERSSFWVDSAAQPLGRSRGAAIRQSEECWCYLPSWKRIASAGASESAADTPLVLLRPASAESEALHRELAAIEPVIDVVAGTGFERVEERTYRLDPRRSDHFDELADRLQTRRARFLHLWSLPDDDGPDDRRRGFDSLLVLAQALHPRLESLDMVCVSATSQEVTGEERIDPWQALLVGPARVIPFERPGWRVRLVDLDRMRGELASDNASRLVDELAFGDAEPLVAYRGRHRWAPTYAPFELPASDAPGMSLAPGATCLVAGGLGGIGRVLAEALFDRHQARLALVVRTPLPDRARWEELRASKKATPSSLAAMETVQRLEGRGAEIEIVQADISDRGALERAVAAIEESFGSIDLAVHAAGVAGGRALDLESLDEAHQALAAKVEGTSNLYELVCRDGAVPLVLCSSLAAEIGGFGQLDYCAANAFLDAFAAASGSESVLTIDWDTWSESGMAVDTEVPPELEAARREALRFGLTDTEGGELFLRLLATRERRVLVSTRPIEARLASERRDHLGEPEADDSSPADALAAERPDLSTGFVAPRSETEERVAEIWQRLFGVDRIGVDDDFFELGGHSLLATQMLNRLRKVYPDARLGLATLFDAPTVAQLANEIETAGAGAESLELPDRRDLVALPLEERREQLRDYLERRLSQRTAFDPDRLDARALAAEIVWDLRRDLDLVVYPHELEGASSVDELAATIAAVIQGIGAPPGVEQAPRTAAAPRKPRVEREKNSGMVFLLSAPRSGSTLMRLMMAGHSSLFCPPELALLSAESLQEWKLQQHGIFARDGLTRALIELEDLDPQQALDLIDAMVESDLSIQRVYARLQAACGEAVLVDKSPAYALDPAALDRAERLFDAPHYLLLTRHPVAVIESLVRHRMEALLADGPVDDPWRFAESVWRTANTNLSQLASKVGDRAFGVRFEDLVTSPEETMRGVARFLDIEFEPGLVEPYAGGRMIDGPGDPDIFQHDRIEAELADAWRRVELPIELEPSTLELAERLGYELAGEGSGTKAPGSDELAAGEADRLLERLDELTDEEVEATLSSLLENSTEDDRDGG